MSRGRFFFAPRGRTPLERFARGLLVAGVFALAVAAYQWHYRRLADELAARGTVADALGVLSREDRAWLLGQAALLKRHFGLHLTVRLGGGPASARPDDPRAVRVSCDPDGGAAGLTVPPLAAAALPEGFAADLDRQVVQACRRDRVREGVLGAVGLLTITLGEAADRGKGEGT